MPLKFFTLERTLFYSGHFIRESMLSAIKRFNCIVSNTASLRLARSFRVTWLLFSSDTHELGMKKSICKVISVMIYVKNYHMLMLENRKGKNSDTMIHIWFWAKYYGIFVNRWCKKFLWIYFTYVITKFVFSSFGCLNMIVFRYFYCAFMSHFV